MKKLFFLLYCVFFLALVSYAQTGPDSSVTPSPAPADTVIRPVKRIIPKRDTSARKVVTVPLQKDSSLRIGDSATALRTDSVVTPPAPVKATEVQLQLIRNFMNALRAHPYFNFFGQPLILREYERKADDQDPMFYFLAALIFYFALVKVFFSKYVDNIMTLFFRVTMRQTQIREQLLQTPMASLLLNVLFIVNGGLFLTFVARHYGVMGNWGNWVLMGYSCLLLSGIYLGKFILLKIAGWIFNIGNATDTYVFIVFLVNKMIGIFLLPVLVLLAFPYPPLYPVVITLSFILLVLFIGYRFIISYKPIRNEIKVSRFHFFIYLCAFEIAPLLLIYKVLLIFVDRSH